MREFEINSNNTTERVSVNISSALWNYMLDAVESAAVIEMKDKNLLCLIVYNNTGDIFSSKIKNKGQIVDFDIKNINTLKKKGITEKKRDVIYDGSKVGEVRLYFSISSTKDRFRSLFLKVIIQNLLLFLTVSLSIYLIFKNLIIKNLKIISEQIEKISSGDADLTKKVEIKSYDEIGILSKHINKFITKIDTIITKIKKVSYKAKNISSNLSEQTKISKINLNNINKFMNKISDKIQILNTEINNSNGAFQDIYIIIENLSKRITEQSTFITESSASIEQMAVSINSITNVTAEKKKFSDQLGLLAKDGEKKMNETLESMNEIEKSASVIFDMIKVINNVAGQTNLLAMNASIEAAHAGEYGKGFAVVADEIRNLAEATAQNSKNISTTLKGVIEKIKNSVTVTKDTSNSISTILNGIYNLGNSMTEMLSSLQEISLGSSEMTNSISGLIKITNDILDSSKTISDKTIVIENAMSKVLELSDEHSLSIDEMNNGVNFISNSLNTVLALSEGNSNNMHQLDEEISKFKTTTNSD